MANDKGNRRKSCGDEACEMSSSQPAICAGGEFIHQQGLSLAGSYSMSR